MTSRSPATAPRTIINILSSFITVAAVATLCVVVVGLEPEVGGDWVFGFSAGKLTSTRLVVSLGVGSPSSIAATRTEYRSLVRAAGSAFTVICP